MAKSEYFKKHRAGDRLVKVDLPAESGLPELYARAVMHHEFADLCDVETVNGKKDIVVNYTRAMMTCIVTFDGLPFFGPEDEKGLRELGVTGASPFTKAINEANGLSDPKAETPEAKPPTA